MAQERRHPQVVNADEVEPREMLKGTRFGGKMRSLGRATGAKGLGCTLYEIAPGRTAFPMHAHMVNEEAIYVLEGEGTLRLGEQRVAVRPGDYITLLAGPEHPHQLANTGPGPLRYLCLSTMQQTDVVTYPDSKKVAAITWRAGENRPAMRVMFMSEDQIEDYYAGEETGE